MMHNEKYVRKRSIELSVKKDMKPLRDDVDLSEITWKMYDATDRREIKDFINKNKDKIQPFQDLEKFPMEADKTKWDIDYKIECRAAMQKNFSLRRIKHFADVLFYIKEKEAQIDREREERRKKRREEFEKKVDPTRGQKILAKVQQAFMGIVNVATSLVKKLPNGGPKRFLLRILSSAKKRLAQCKALKTLKPELAQKWTEEADQMTDQINQIKNQAKATDAFIDDFNDDLDYDEAMEEYEPEDDLDFSIYAID